MSPEEIENPVNIWRSSDSESNILMQEIYKNQDDDTRQLIWDAYWAEDIGHIYPREEYDKYVDKD